MRKRKKSLIVGGWFWTTGPLVLATSTVRAIVQTTRDAKTLKALAKATKGPVLARQLGKQRVLLFPGQFPSTWHQLGPRAGVLVRLAGHSNHEAEALSVDPWAVAERDWKLAVSTVTLDGPADGARELFDAVPRDPQPIAREDANVLPVTLPPGKYVVDHATLGERDFAVVLYRFRAKDELPQPPKGKRVAVQPGPPAILELRKETAALARRLKFVGTDGGPLLACPRSLLPQWHGVYDADGEYVYGSAPCDYDRACDAKGLILSVGKGQALVLEQVSTAFLQMEPGTAYLLFWVGADAGSHVLEAVLSAPSKAWKKQKEVFSMTGKELALLDSAHAGKTKPAYLGELAPGRYTMERMQEYDGEIRVGSELHGLMAGALRLTRLG
ncbi:MAG: hypothetical protein IPO88_03425 [Nannocystis sp.]|uniref:Imm21 family immunity protein n=1 Tax=Nannocystis sp. TaxID=1962667 RepID=UPI0024281331|nr:Imm21 family immunity protein [Nannocystis sp.]MBK9752553.1 hypothetical protein [Nannocystis sp.]